MPATPIVWAAATVFLAAVMVWLPITARRQVQILEEAGYYSDPGGR